ncbi:MAG: hypothetical protein H7039_14135 [Bryobacteraceae bacterium]|nr:hypothetical protein [Bryobacteraceae bacterium]
MQQPETGHDPGNDSVTLTLAEKPRYRWHHKFAAVMAAIFCFELGVFLLIYPWVTDWAPSAAVFPLWVRQAWQSPFFRGALSGLGVLNIWISFVEVFRFRRFSA